MVLNLLDLLWHFHLSLLSLLFFLDFPQCLALLSFPQVPIHLLCLSFLAVRSSRRPFAPTVSSWTRHSLQSLITNLSFCTFPSLGPLRSRDAWHSRDAIWPWNAWKTMTQYRFLKIKTNFISWAYWRKGYLYITIEKVIGSNGQCRTSVNPQRLNSWTMII